MTQLALKSSNYGTVFFRESSGPASVVEQILLILNAMEDWPPIVAFGLFHIDAIELWSGTTRNFQGEFARDTTRDGLVFSENPLDKLLQRIAAVAV